MNSQFKSLKGTETTPLVALFAVVAAILGGVMLYQRLFSAGTIDFGPAMMWLAVAIPAGIFGSIFLQLRAAERTKRVAQQVQARIVELESESSRVTSGRRSFSAKLDPTQPTKDPFETL